MEIPWEWGHKYAKMGMGMGRVQVTMGMGMATFSCVPKFPSIGRLDANAICDSAEGNTTLIVRDSEFRF